MLSCLRTCGRRLGSRSFDSDHRISSEQFAATAPAFLRSGLRRAKARAVPVRRQKTLAKDAPDQRPGKSGSQEVQQRGMPSVRRSISGSGLLESDIQIAESIAPRLKRCEVSNPLHRVGTGLLPVARAALQSTIPTWFGFSNVFVDGGIALREPPLLSHEQTMPRQRRGSTISVHRLAVRSRLEVLEKEPRRWGRGRAWPRSPVAASPGNRRIRPARQQFRRGPK